MKRHALTLAAATGLILSAGAVLAQTEIDSDGDGMYSFEELLAAFPTLTEETFTTIDTSADGMVDADELAAAQAEGLVPATEG